MYQQTFLRENLHTGIVDPAYNRPVRRMPTAIAVNGFTDPAQCAGGRAHSEPRHSIPFCCPLRPHPRRHQLLLPRPHRRQATRALHPGPDHQEATGCSTSAFAATSTTASPFSARRSRASASAYNIKRTNTVLRVSYARTLETPFNENLVLSDNGCYDPVIQGIFGRSALHSRALQSRLPQRVPRRTPTGLR